MKYLKFKGNVNIEKLYITEKLELFVQFSGSIKKIVKYNGIESISYNNHYLDDYGDFLVDDIINRKINNNDFDLVNTYFPLKYDLNYFLKNVSKKLSILLIEGDITLYLIYNNHEIQ